MNQRSGSSGPVATEVAVLSGVLADGETIPLPFYSDGTLETGEECHWLVSVNILESEPESIANFSCGADQGRVVTCTGIDRDGNSLVGRANYLIIARRSAPSVPAQGENRGSLKAQFSR
ncbi:MAG: hypothetical protein AB7V45_11420 [Candidatus Krumholzibacteriia bacterium]